MKNVASLLLLLMLPILAHAQKGVNDRYAEKLMRTQQIINYLYVDDVDQAKVVEAGIKSMLEQLDPHSTYSNPAEVKRMMESMQGNFEGIGVQFNVVDDTLFVIQTVRKGPSERAGIQPGDRIVAVNDTTIAGVKMPQDEMVARLRGKKGSVVKLNVVRRGVDRIIKFKVKRDKIETKSVDVAYMLNTKSGYIRITSFTATTGAEFSAAVDSLMRQGMKNLIIDLRGNGGGYLDASVDVLSELFSDIKMVVYTEGRAFPRYDYKTKGNGSFAKGNVAVLIDETSASASEILAGAVQDWDRGIVVGRRSFGKGLVQRAFDLSDGSMIRLTVARYYTPSGRNIQKPYNDSIPYSDDLMKRYSSGELMNADSIHFADSLMMKTMRLKRNVYGGGGIMPDHFVPLDTLKYTDYHLALSRSGSINKTVLHYLDENRKTLMAKYPNAKVYKNKFSDENVLLEMLREQGKRDGVKEPTAEEWKKSKKRLALQMKALLASDIWELSDYMDIIASDDEMLQQALKLVETRNMDKLLMKR